MAKIGMYTTKSLTDTTDKVFQYKRAAGYLIGGCRPLFLNWSASIPI